MVVPTIFFVLETSFYNYTLVFFPTVFQGVAKASAVEGNR